MGGAIVAKAAATDKIKKLAAVVVLDVVEGTALESLKYMMTVLTKRPQKFQNYSEAIMWR